MLSRIPWFIEPGRGWWCGFGKVRVNARHPMKLVRPLPRIFLSSRIYHHPFISFLLADFCCNFLLEKKRKTVDVIFWHTFSQSRVVCMAGRSILCSCCAPSCPAHAPNFPSELPSVQTLHWHYSSHSYKSLCSIFYCKQVITIQICDRKCDQCLNLGGS